MGRGRIPSIENFWNKVAKGDGESCWLFTGAKGGSLGYGVIRYRTKSWFAHRLSWTEAYGHIPDGMCVCHACDVPNCVRPDHLFLGTHDDNMKDRSAKGRAPRGIGNKMHKLTEDDVRAIRKAYAAGGTSLPKLGVLYGVSHVAIAKIVHRETWAWLTD